MNLRADQKRTRMAGGISVWGRNLTAYGYYQAVTHKRLEIAGFWAALSGLPELVTASAAPHRSEFVTAA